MTMKPTPKHKTQKLQLQRESLRTLTGLELDEVNGGARRPAMIVLKGLQGPLTVKGAQYGSAVMQPWEKTLNDQKIAEVLTEKLDGVALGVRCAIHLKRVSKILVI